MADVTDNDTVTPDLPASTGVRIGILTSGGDAQGMNAAVRAVVRSALSVGAEVFAILEGYQGMIDGGEGIRQMTWNDVGSILHRGGTVISTFRSRQMRERSGRTSCASLASRSSLWMPLRSGGNLSSTCRVGRSRPARRWRVSSGCGRG
ncbi:6-phosphofructokinase [Cutibacterium avidum]|uniref:6-phosphofructokinase n=1 Tax=Cutibacterium avidum TaxID=33010 RepID=UPI0023537513|nr:6-phosphofructokinase [Cutibacterium avidum]